MMNSIEQILGYVFKDKKLLKTALTHSSLSNEIGGDNYERLEFLGDAVVELIVSNEIYKYEFLDSGLLTKLRASLVSTSNFSNISTNLKLDKELLKSKSLNTLSEKTKADILESILGAIYLDGGLEEVQKIVDKYIIIDENNIREHLTNCIDYKTKFQEDMQKQKKSFEYIVVNESGQDHNKIFTVELRMGDITISQALGKSIHIAEEECARKYYLDK